MRKLIVYPANGGSDRTWQDVEEIIPGNRNTLSFKLKSGLAITVSPATDWILIEEIENAVPDSN